MMLGLDIGTSAVKAVLVDDDEQVVAETSAALTVQRPRSGWSEQDPDAWWAASQAAIGQLPAKARAAIRAVGLSGQMHGAVVLDDADRPLRPCILWNDGRAAEECTILEGREPRARTITGNAAMPGFTAPKLVWLQRHEPEIFAKIRKVLTPKDYIRLKLTGDHATDMSDASGAYWLDVGTRRWSPAMLDACRLDERHMAGLFEGDAPTGRLSAQAAAALGLPAVPVAAGGGDNAAGAVGVGVVRPGEAFLSLGTSGVIFVAGAHFAPAAGRGAHAFCHALPNRWHQMAVILSAASCLDWVARLTGFPDVAAALAAAEAAEPFTSDITFLPHLAGERTPHNDPGARGAFTGLDLDADGPALVRAVLEGVAFALAEGLAVLAEAGARIPTLSVIGGGARSPYWGRILAAALDRPLQYRQDGHIGPAFGAARLARLAVGGEAPDDLCRPPPVVSVIQPEPALVDAAAEQRPVFNALYLALRPTRAL